MAGLDPVEDSAQISTAVDSSPLEELRGAYLEALINRADGKTGVVPKESQLKINPKIRAAYPGVAYSKDEDYLFGVFGLDSIGNRKVTVQGGESSGAVPLLTDL